jgi:hypothetical protein
MGYLWSLWSCPSYQPKNQLGARSVIARTIDLVDDNEISDIIDSADHADCFKSTEETFSSKSGIVKMILNERRCHTMDEG